MEISRATFDRQRRPRFGTANPERMRMEFWEWMIRGEGDLRGDADSPLGAYGMISRDGKLKHAYGPWRARDLFGLTTARGDGPIWTFERMGATRTELADGRVVCVGGEHEDSYDPDFCIYNDVVILGPGDRVEIYGYPKDVFPPTDFHSATLAGGRIVILGSIGYPDDRQPGRTPVHVLDPATYAITRLETAGEAPGWISRHEASLDPDGLLTVRGGRVFDAAGDGKAVLRQNFEDYGLDLATGSWRQLTRRNWSEFQIGRADRRPLRRVDKRPDPDAFDAGTWVPRKIGFDAEDLLPPYLFDLAEAGDRPRSVRLDLRGVPVAIEVGTFEVRIVVEDPLPAGQAAGLAELIRGHAEGVIGAPCTCRHASGPA